MENMYTCKGCGHSYRDESFISEKRIEISNYMKEYNIFDYIPRECFSCYNFFKKNALRKNYTRKDFSYYTCIGCKYQQKDGRPDINNKNYAHIKHKDISSICDNCYLWSHNDCYRSNYKSRKVFNKMNIFVEDLFKVDI